MAENHHLCWILASPPLPCRASGLDVNPVLPKAPPRSWYADNMAWATWPGLVALAIALNLAELVLRQ